MDLEKHLHRCTPEDLKDKAVVSVLDALRDFQFPVRTGCTARLRDAILHEILATGWSSNVKVDYRSKITITAMHSEIGLCLQTGNMARFYADLLKLQLLFSKGRIRRAVYILPTKRSAKVLGANTAQFERLVDELDIFAEVISVPMLVVGFE